MKIRHTPLALALLLALPATASAQSIGYSYLEAGYSRIESVPDADGWAVNGSVALSDNFHLFAGYSQNETSRGSIDLDIFNVGVGYNHILSSRLHLLGRAGYTNYDTNFGSIDGWFTEVGLRGELVEGLQGWALAGYEDGDGISGEFFGKIGALIKFAPRWGISIEAKLIDGDQQYFIGPRFEF